MNRIVGRVTFGVLVVAAVVAPAPGHGRSRGETARPAEVARSASWLARAVSIGYAHSCALMLERTVKCWGDNHLGQLGLGSAGAAHPRPVDVTGLPTGISGLGTGGVHQCAVTDAGGVMCWGYNGQGQLGDGTSMVNGTSPSDRPSPVQVAGLERGAAAVVAGYIHTCALMEDGGVECWGLRMTADGNVAQEVPLDVADLGGRAAGLAAGGLHTCAVLDSGVKCWGDSTRWQSGGRQPEGVEETPVSVPGLGAGIKAIAAGAYHTCVIVADGRVKCWGAGDYGQLGGGASILDDRGEPVDVVGLDGPATAVAAGGGHTCALLADGRVQCWGSNLSGQLGTGQIDADTVAGPRPVPHPVPARVVGLPGRAVAIAASVMGGHMDFQALPGEKASGLSPALEPVPYHGHTCALLSDGCVWCWGGNVDGQLGDGTNTASGVPRPVSGCACRAFLPLTERQG